MSEPKKDNDAVVGQIATAIMLGLLALIFGPISAGEFFACAAVILAINIIRAVWR